MRRTPFRTWARGALCTRLPLHKTITNLLSLELIWRKVGAILIFTLDPTSKLRNGQWRKSWFTKGDGLKLQTWLRTRQEMQKNYLIQSSNRIRNTHGTKESKQEIKKENELHRNKENSEIPDSCEEDERREEWMNKRTTKLTVNVRKEESERSSLFIIVRFRYEKNTPNHTTCLRISFIYMLLFIEN